MKNSEYEAYCTLHTLTLGVSAVDITKELKNI